jgi:hypothetical protein
MPTGESIEATLSQKKWFIFRSTVGRIKAVCVSPTRQLLAGEEPSPLTSQQVNELLRQIPPPVKDVPSTLVLMSTCGFTLEAHEAAERRADGAGRAKRRGGLERLGSGGDQGAGRSV